MSYVKNSNLFPLDFITIFMIMKNLIILLACVGVAVAIGNAMSKSHKTKDAN